MGTRLGMFRTALGVANIGAVSAPTVTPSSASVPINTTQQFIATIAVVWSLQTGVGSIAAGGVYTAPGTPGSATVRATAVEDATKFTEVFITVTNPLTYFTIGTSLIGGGDTIA